MAGFHSFVVTWIHAILLACFFGLSESNQLSDRELTEPGVIVGILVGVVGVLVVVGVTILLCCLFCCKNDECCSCCCRGEERYLEAGTVPIKAPTQESNPSVSTVSQSHPSRQARPDLDSSSILQYDDAPRAEWNVADLMKKKAVDPERGSKESLSSARQPENPAFLQADRDIPDILSDSEAKRSGKTPVRRRLQYEADAELSLHNDSALAERSERPKKRHTEAPRHGRELSAAGNKHRKRLFQSSQEGNEDFTTVQNPNSANDSREFPMLEFEPRKRSSPDQASQAQEKTDGADDWGFNPAQFEHRPRATQPPLPAPRSRKDRHQHQQAAGGGREFPLLEYASDQQHGHDPSSRAPWTVEDPGGGVRDWEGSPVELDERAYQHPEHSYQHPEHSYQHPEHSYEHHQPQQQDSDWEFRPVDFHHESHQQYEPHSAQPYQPQPTLPHDTHYLQQPQDRSMKWGAEEDRRTRDQREIHAPRATVSVNPRLGSGPAQYFQGRDNLAFNNDSTETSV